MLAGVVNVRKSATIEPKTRLLLQMQKQISIQSLSMYIAEFLFILDWFVTPRSCFTFDTNIL